MAKSQATTNRERAAAKKVKKKAPRPPAKKVAAIHREREGRAKKKRRSPEEIQESLLNRLSILMPPQPEGMPDPEISAKADAIIAKYAGPAEPVQDSPLTPYGEAQEKQAAWQAEFQRGNLSDLVEAANAKTTGYEIRRSNLAETMDAYYTQYGPDRNCGDMVAHILEHRTLPDIEEFVYEMTGKGWPHLNPGHRRMNAGNVIRRLVRRADIDTMAWLLATPTN